MPASDISVRPVREGDEHALVELFAGVFGRAITPQHWRWKLQHPWCAVQNVWLAVTEQQRPVLQYAGIPLRFWLLGEPAAAMVSVDSMTAPDFRRRGLLTRVVQHAYAQWRQQGIAFVLGLPNEQWGSRVEAVGFRRLFPLQWMLCPLRPQALLARRLRAPWLNRASFLGAAWNRWLATRLRPDPQVQVETVAAADEAFDQIWQACREDFKFSTVRDRSWVNWRFFCSPLRKYHVLLARRAGKPVGYLAYGLVDSGETLVALLAELLVPADDAGARDALLAHWIEALTHSRTEAISTLAVPGTAHFRRLRRAGFFRRQAFAVHYVPLRPDLPLDLMQHAENWNLTGADFDAL